MPSALERLRQVNSLERLRSVDDAPASAPGPSPAGLQGMADVLSRSGMPIMAAIARPKETAQTVAEGLGAAGGAALGTMVGGVPGAVVGGAGGARLGHAAGSYLFGEEPDPGEMTAAGIAGAAGPAVGPIFRHSARIFAKLPTVQGAVRSAQVAAERARRAATGTQAERVIERMADSFDRQLASIAEAVGKARAGHRTGFEAVDKKVAAFQKGKLSREALDQFLDFTEQKLADFATRVPKGVADALTTPKMAVERGAAAVPVPNAQSGAIPGALGALAGGAYGGMEGATSAAALGYLFGQVRGRMAFRLSNNERFVAWATGLSPREPLAQSALSFVGDVLLQADPDSREAEDASEFYDRMLDFIEAAPEAALGLVGAGEPRPAE